MTKMVPRQTANINFRTSFQGHRSDTLMDIHRRSGCPRIRNVSIQIFLASFVKIFLKKSELVLKRLGSWENKLERPSTSTGSIGVVRSSSSTPSRQGICGVGL